MWGQVGFLIFRGSQILSNNTPLNVGDTFSVTLSGVTPNAPVSVARSDGKTADIGTSDSSGSFAYSGTITSAYPVGTFTETWKVGGVAVGGYDFTVGPGTTTIQGSQGGPYPNITGGTGDTQTTTTQPPGTGVLGPVIPTATGAGAGTGSSSGTGTSNQPTVIQGATGTTGSGGGGASPSVISALPDTIAGIPTNYILLGVAGLVVFKMMSKR